MTCYKIEVFGVDYGEANPNGPSILGTIAQSYQGQRLKCLEDGGYSAQANN